MKIDKAVTVEAQMLIRRPVSDVFEAFVNPETTQKFWFTSSSGRLESGKQIRWDWEMFGVGTLLTVKELIPNQRILIEWGEPSTSVEWSFIPGADDTTLLKISNWGFHGDDNEVLAQAIDSKGGFSFVLAGAKAWLEYGVRLNLVTDQSPGFGT